MDSDYQVSIKAIVAAALAEDIGSGDVTTLWTIAADEQGHGDFLAKGDGVVAGLDVVDMVFSLLDSSVRLTRRVHDGDRVVRGQVLARIEGPARVLLTGERTALNLLQRMSGIATETRRYVDAVAGTRAVILDTRKTVPGLRILDKWAVRLGGGRNHRIGLFDMVLIKDNHIAAADGIAAAVHRVREAMRAEGRDSLRVEVEVTSLAQLDETLALPVDRIMLDNMSLDEMREAVRRTAGRVELEASGGVSLTNVAQVAATGVDLISVGALTHSPRALDISLELAG